MREEPHRSLALTVSGCFNWTQIAQKSQKTAWKRQLKGQVFKSGDVEKTRSL